MRAGATSLTWQGAPSLLATVLAKESSLKGQAGKQGGR